MRLTGFCRRKIRCWREGHDWKKIRGKFFGATREGVKCKRCGSIRRTSNKAVVEKPLKFTDFEGVIFCPFYGDPAPEISENEVVCEKHGTILSVKDSRNRSGVKGDGSE